MADEVDISAARAEFEEPYLLAAAKRPAGPVPNGLCHWCDEIVSDTARWCDRDCLTSWERDRRLRRID